MGSSKKVTVGYWYGLGFHSVYCHGPVDAVTEIIVGERTAYTGSVAVNADLTLANRNLFGGESKEGGIDGRARIRMGGSAQVADPYLTSKLGSVPAFRGVLSLIWDGLVSANNPYVKPWSIRARRIPSAWNPTKATIAVNDANPAHIIRECLTNTAWGMGYPVTEMDDAAFTAAADALFTEGFGLSFLWKTSTSIEEFILSVCQHIDGMVYVHPTTGLFRLKLARADYTASTLPIYSPANVLQIEDFSRIGWGEIANEVTVIYRDSATDKDSAMTVQDIAAIELQGSVISTTLQYPGISTAALANRVATRELKQLSSALAKVTIIANRSANALSVGDPFKLTWPAYGITEMIMRAARISYGERNAGVIRIEAVQDVFGLPAAIYADPPPTGWTDPVSLPAAAPFRQLAEASYWVVAREIAGDSDTLLSEVLPDEGFVQLLMARPSGDAFAYTILARASTSVPWTDNGEGAFAPTAQLGAAVVQGVANFTVAITAGLGLDEVSIEPETLALIDSELFRVVALDIIANTVTLACGMVDTVPAAHASGNRIWFFEAAPTLTPAYLFGDTVRVKALTRTGLGVMTEASAPENTTGIVRRFIRPYPPGNLKFNAVAYPVVTAGPLVITWATRNRKTQTALLVTQADGSITAEVGQTTTIRIKDKLGTLVRTYSALTAVTQTWDLATAVTDAGTNGDTVTIEMESARDGYTSLYPHSITFARAGYGMRYGEYYGGI